MNQDTRVESVTPVFTNKVLGAGHSCTFSIFVGAGRGVALVTFITITTPLSPAGL